MIRSFLLPLVVFLLCTRVHAMLIQSSDPKATAETQALLTQLHALSTKHILFGHQDSLAYGMGWRGAPFKSDVEQVCGKFPAVFGWDLGHIGDEKNIDDVPFSDMKTWIEEVYHRGGVITISWHARVPVTGQSSWTREPVVKHILPGGKHHPEFMTMLSDIADFLESLRGDRGELIPVIFRPWHENHGSWFWWGEDHCTVEEYRELWRVTMDYLRETRNLHNLLTAYSPNSLFKPEDYLKRYPGDDLIDVFGFDDYHRIEDPRKHAEVLPMLEIVVDQARKHRKLAALTETGSETIPNPKWWTEVLLPLLQRNDKTKALSYVLVWRNGRPDHYYAPYPKQASAEDFVKFEKNPYTLFLEDLPKLYE